MRQPPLIGIVGPCASGKTTLIHRLTSLGYHCRHIAQEHSYVQDMWKRLTNPDILVYLIVSYEATLRRKKLNWSKEEFQTQLDRLHHAHVNADILIETDTLTPDQLTSMAVEKIESILQQQ
jgi:deoxyadenosine/deoxycytidine kinase